MSNIVKEFESRIMLTESEYFEIVSHFMRLHPNKQFLKNTNIYLDTDDLYLRKNHITFRIRIINDIKCELTIKIKGSNGDDEINDALNLKEVDMILKGHICPDGSVKNFLRCHGKVYRHGCQPRGGRFHVRLVFLRRSLPDPLP